MSRIATVLAVAAGFLLALPAAAQDDDADAAPVVEPLNRTEAAQQLPEVGDDEDQQAAAEANSLIEADLSPEAVEAIEEALTNAGYDPGAVDGVWTEETRQALTIFKQTEEIDSEGLDMATLEALDLEDRALELGLEETAETPEGTEETTTTD